MVLAWLVIAGLAYRPSGFAAPVFLPALGLAAMMACFQALSWSPFGNPWVRVVITSVLMTALFAVLTALKLAGVSIAGIAAGLLPVFVLAAILAWAGLTHDRRGDVWEFGLDRIGEMLETHLRRRVRRERPFRSPMAAQLWYEWRCHGLYLLVLIAGPWLMMGALMLLVGPNPNKFPILLAATLGMPLVMAGTQGPAVAQMQPFWVRHRGLMTFLGTRPMRTGDLLAAKFRMVWRSVLLMWVLVLAATGLMVLAAGHRRDIVELGRAFFARYPVERGALILVLGTAMAPVLAWKQLTDAFVPVLTGRRWVGDGLTALGAAGFIALCALGAWCGLHPSLLPKLLAAVPWLVGVMLVLKGTISVWAYRAAVERGLVDRRQVARLLACWLIVAGCVVGLGIRLLPSAAGTVSKPVMLLGLLTFVPLARFALAPLALDWNRHR